MSKQPSAKVDNGASRVSVLVAEAGTDWSKWNDAWEKKSGEIVRLVQRERENATDFAERVAERVARLGRQRAVLERLALVVQDSHDPSLRTLRSDVLSAVTLHLIRSRTPLTIRLAGENEGKSTLADGSFA